MCLTPWGTLLVADEFNHRVAEVDPDTNGRTFTRVLGVGTLARPRFVHCNRRVLAVSQQDSVVVVLSLAHGSVQARLGPKHLGTALYPCGLRLLADGGGLVVGDNGAGHVLLFSTDGTTAPLAHGLACPIDVVECDGGTAFLVAELHGNGIAKVSRADGNVIERFACGSEADDGRMVMGPSALALLPDGTLVVRMLDAQRVEVFTSLVLRMAWLALAASR